MFKIALALFSIVFVLVSNSMADTTIVIHKTRPRILVPSYSYAAPMVAVPDTIIQPTAPDTVVTYQQRTPIYTRSYVGVGVTAVGGQTWAERRHARHARRHADRAAHHAARAAYHADRS